MSTNRAVEPIRTADKPSHADDDLVIHHLDRGVVHALSPCVMFPTINCRTSITAGAEVRAA